MNFATKDDIAALRREINSLREELRGIKGIPVIQGYVGKRLDLNGNFNIIEHGKTHADIEARVSALESA